MSAPLMSRYSDFMRRNVEEFTAVRHDLHRHPELGFEEHRTSETVANCLQVWGYEVEHGLGGTGVVGRLKRGNGARRLGIRADMDALPIQEATGLPYASGSAGVMHACGHDGHTAMLLGAAKFLAQEGNFSGTLNLIFQPAEEGLGGALKMMEDGLFEKYPCDAVFAMHQQSATPQGRLVFRDGAMLASSDYVKVTLTGTGGHGARPHRCRDPIVAAASIIMALQTVVSRNVDPMQTAVVTVGAIHSGVANNVIPQEAVLEISVRALNAEVRDILEERIKALVAAQAESLGVAAQVEYRNGYPVLVNTPAETAFARQVALDLFGPSQVTLHGDAITASEDFAFMLQRVPGSYLFIGNGDCGRGPIPGHNPGFDFNDGNLPVGSAYWACLAEQFLKAEASYSE